MQGRRHARVRRCGLSSWDTYMSSITFPSGRESVSTHRRREGGTYQVYEDVLRFTSMESC